MVPKLCTQYTVFALRRSYELNPRPRQFVVSEVPDPNSEPRLFVVYGDGTAEEWMSPTRAQTALETAREVAEAPWSVAEWAVALRFDNPRATLLVLVLGDTLLRVLRFQTP